MLKKNEEDAVMTDTEVAPEEPRKRANNEDGDEPKKKRIKNLYRQPTAAELNQLHETENLFNSNLFRLQINEVLQEVKVKEKTCKNIQTWFEKLKRYLLTIPENDAEYDLSEPTLQKEIKVKIPIADKLECIKVAFKFHKFTEVFVVGSYKYECAINSKLCIDIAIVIPSDTFTKNDSVNYRYHKKYSYYIAIVASHLLKSDLVADLQYSLHENCETKPILTFKPEGKLGNHMSVNLLLFTHEDSFKLSRFSTCRNNLREAWFFSESEVESKDQGPATPFYNASVLQDLTQSINNSYLEEILKNGDNLKQAIVLLKIWLRQRHLEISGHIVSMLIAYLVQIKRINNIMSSYQIVRNVWIFINSSSWDTKGISLLKDQTSSVSSLEEFLKCFPVVFLDRTGYYNICWRMTHGTYMALKRESSLAVQMLDNMNINSFIPLFMTTQKFHLQFDEILRFRDGQAVHDEIYKCINRNDKINYGLDKAHLIVKKLYDILLRGTGDRCKLILYSPKDYNMSWPLKQRFSKAQCKGKQELRFGFVLNCEEAMNTVEKGPPANLPEADDFRAFWGAKSELRRFQDGSITETCVWDGDTLSERRSVIKQIVLYLLQLKFGIAQQAFYISDQLDSVLVCKEFRPEFEYGTGEEATVRLIKTFDSLRKELRDLTDLPLNINSVYGTSAVFSYTDPLPPLPHGSPATGEHWYRDNCCLIKDGQSREDFHIRLPTFIKTSRAIIEFGHSGKWPGNIEAFRRLKAAFHVQIAENLAKQSQLVTHPYPDHVDVLKDGYVFRLEIAHQKEINLLRRGVENGVVKYRESQESEDMHTRLILLPRLRGALHGLHQKHPAYGPVVSLAKRWLSSHLLDCSHFPDTALELIVAHVFVRPEPYEAPARPTTGLVALLALMATADWRSQALILNFNEQLKRDEIIDIEAKFAAERASLPALFIVTPHDLESPGVWTRRGPSENVLARVQMLARSALQYVEKALLEDTLDNVLGMFVPSLSGYSLLIRLHAQYVPQTCERVSERPTWHSISPVGEQTVIPVADFNPVERYLHELRTAYDEFALFFHDQYGGDVIAVLWRPGLTDEQDFQALKSNGTKPKISKKQAKCSVNIDAIIEDFKILGEGLVKDVEIC